MRTIDSLRLPCALLLSVFAVFFSACSMTGEKVFAKYAEATNPSAIQKPKSFSMKMSMTQDSDISPLNRPADTKPTVRMHEMNIYCELPDKIYLDSDAVLVAPQSDPFLPARKIADINVVQVFDGRSGWEITSSPQSASSPTTRDLLFFEVDKLKGIVDGAFAINQLDSIGNSKYIGEQEVSFQEPTNGFVVKKNAHVVEAILKGGKKQTLYFDVKDGLLIKTEQIDPLSNEKLISFLSDYQQFGKVRLPTKIQLIPSSPTNPANTTVTLTLEEFSTEASAPAGAFVKPTI